MKKLLSIWKLLAVCCTVMLSTTVWIQGASADPDTGSLPLPPEIELPDLGLGGLLDGFPNFGSLWTFQMSDQPGSWFDSGVNLFGTKSLGVTETGLGKVRFQSMPGMTDSNHTATAILWPDGAKGFPFDQDKAWKKEVHEADLTTPGLYAFACKMHPFMLAAVIKDDPGTVGLDLGKKAKYAGGRTLATDSDLYWRIIRSFFIITNPKNWQDFSDKNPSKKWDPSYAPAPVLAHTPDGKPKLIPNLDVFMQKRFREPIAQPPLFDPKVPGVGEVWLSTQYEKTQNKSKPGTNTAIDAKTWDVTKKVALPAQNLNNPHNLWPSRDQSKLFTTEWFSNKLTVFDRKTGGLIRSVPVGDAPAHVMTRVDTDQVHVGLNGEGSVVELAPDATKIDRNIQVQRAGERQAQPHAHGMSADGKIMVTPNSNSDDSTQIDVPSGKITQKTPTGHLPIASWVHPDGKTFYTSNFLQGTVTCVSTGAPACADGPNKTVQKAEIDLMGNYNQDTGAITGPYGGLNIQTPVSPDGKWVLQANTLTATVTISDTKTNRLVKTLPCEAGCHGANFGAKKGGGYYVYISNKFANTMDVIEIDPNGDGDASDAAIVGRLLTEAADGTKMDDPIATYAGQGGQGVMPIPNVNNGWVQKLPVEFKAELTPAQINPLGAPPVTVKKDAVKAWKVPGAMVQLQKKKSSRLVRLASTEGSATKVRLVVKDARKRVVARTARVAKLGTKRKSVVLRRTRAITAGTGYRSTITGVNASGKRFSQTKTLSVPVQAKK